MNYDHEKVEKKWQKRWKESHSFRTEDDTTKEKLYVLDMFPYPSGEGLHVGHPKGYIATDVYSRHMRMKGKNVLHPMGWDAFGLPAENFALKNHVHPRVAVEKNIQNFKSQLAHIGFDYDWSREINTTDPEFYKWTQWIFLQLFKKSLAYQSNEPINWCPSCMTGLANEDLDGDTCERCGSVVEKRALPQWVLKITAYADRMLADLDALDWPEHIKEAQRNWIGRSQGAQIDFAVSGSDKKIKVFTTRPDTLFGATYVVLAPEHALVKELAARVQNKEEIVAYVKTAAAKPEIERTAEGKEKTGVEIKGVKAINPANGKELPIFIADYVLGGYGTGAIMAVPAHDERDYAFAKKFGLPMREVVVPNIVDVRNPPVEGKKSVERNNVHAIVRDPKTGKYLALKWKQFDWVTFPMGGIEEGESPESAARREVKEETGFTGLKLVKILPRRTRAEYFAAHKDENRVAYTSAVIFEFENSQQEDISSDEKAKHEIFWIDEADLNYEHMTHAEVGEWMAQLAGKDVYAGSGFLVDSGKFSGMQSEEAKKKITEFVGGKLVSTYKIKDWVFSRQRYWGEPIPIIHCPKDGAVPVPEDQLPVKLPEVEHYEPSGTGESPLANITEWVNTTCPVCGGPGKRETNTMPQWAGSSWYYLRFMDPHNTEALVGKDKEKYWAPVDVYVGGDHAVRHLIYARFWHKFLYDIGSVSTIEPFARLEFLGFILAEDGRKMSKRYGNVINPDDVVKTYGADSFRIYEMFMGPFENTVAWSTASIVGTTRFVERVWKIGTSMAKNEEPKESPVAEPVDVRGLSAGSPQLETLLHQTIKKVSEDIEAFKFNTAISQMMVFINAVEKEGKIGKGQWEAFLRLLHPFAPHVTSELAEMAGLSLAAWPAYDEKKLMASSITLAVMVNGKTRGTVSLSPDASKEEAISAAYAQESVAKWLPPPPLQEGKGGVKVIYVPGRILSFVAT